MIHRTSTLNIDCIHPSWQAIIKDALAKVDGNYVQRLTENSEWLPGADVIFAAFALPLDEVNYVLFGETPYPRPASANGYAFWDAAVSDLWSETGLSKAVNRATSLRNLVKMLLVAEGCLTQADTSQSAIANIDKSDKVQTLDELFENFLKHGFLLLNTSLVLSNGPKNQDTRAWEAFMAQVLVALEQHRPETRLLFFGNFAKNLQKMPVCQHFVQLEAEHPYNISFISNENVLNLFKPLDLLRRRYN